MVISLGHFNGWHRRTGTSMKIIFLDIHDVRYSHLGLITSPPPSRGVLAECLVRMVFFPWKYQWSGRDFEAWLLAVATVRFSNDPRSSKCTCVDLPSARILLPGGLRSRLQRSLRTSLRSRPRAPDATFFYFCDFGRQNGRHREVY